MDIALKIVGALVAVIALIAPPLIHLNTRLVIIEAQRLADRRAIDDEIQARSQLATIVAAISTQLATIIEKTSNIERVLTGHPK